MIKKIFHKIKSLVRKKREAVKINATLRALESSEDEAVKSIAKTIKFMKTDKGWTARESACINQIDQIRNACLNSNETVSITDYGAGNKDALRTTKEMEAGVIRQKNISEVYENNSVPNKWGEFLFKLIRVFQPEHSLELGACLGISGAYQVSALKLNGQGKFTTIEGAEELARQADRNLQKLNYPEYAIHRGRFREVLPTILSEDDPIDFAFIDGHHDEEATREYYELIYPFLSDQSILIFDDINWSPGMKTVWQFIYSEGKGIKASFDFKKLGVCVVDKRSQETKKDYYKFSL